MKIAPQKTGTAIKSKKKFCPKLLRQTKEKYFNNVNIKKGI